MMKRNAFQKMIFLGTLTLLSIVLLSACMRSQSKGVVSEQYVPPTLVATVFKTPTIDPFQPTADPRGPCTDDMSFLDDLTVPDGSVFEPGQSFVKQWQVQNSGTCEWTSKYSVRIIGGSNLGVEAKQKLEPIAPGEVGTIEITFIAPEEPGSYYSQWQAYDQRGKPFGQDIFVDIIVSQTY